MQLVMNPGPLLEDATMSTTRGSSQVDLYYFQSEAYLSAIDPSVIRRSDQEPPEMFPAPPTGGPDHRVHPYHHRVGRQAVPGERTC